jgi:outer membrane autotransporter protein
MNSHDLIPVARQEWLDSVIRVGRIALPPIFMLVLSLPVQGQTFDSAVLNALAGDACNNPVPPAGTNLLTICTGIPALTGSASSGSTTALSAERVITEERKAERLIGPVNLFASLEYERLDKDVTTFEPGYTTKTGRVAVGADYSFSDRLLAGGALKYAKDDGTFDAGGDFKTDYYGFLLYANFVPVPKSFVNVSTGYTFTNNSITRFASITRGGTTELLGAVAGDPDGDEFMLEVNGGYDYNYKSFTIGPRAGLRYKRIEVDSYSETGTTGLELIYDQQTAKSLTGVLGVFGSTAISKDWGVLVPQVNLEYLHEFEDPQRTITFRFVDNLTAGPFFFQNDPPDRNYFNLGLGVAAVWPHGISGFLNVRSLLGYQDHSKYTITAGLRIEM